MIQPRLHTSKYSQKGYLGLLVLVCRWLLTHFNLAGQI